MSPDLFQNKTNDMTHSRWLLPCNPGLSDVIAEKIGEAWMTGLYKLKELKQFDSNENFPRALIKVKKEYNMKYMLAEYIKQEFNIEVNPSSMLDVHVKRIRDYKRQLVNCLHIITHFNTIKRDPDNPVTPRTIIIGGNVWQI